MSTAKKLMGTTATGGFTAVEDVFQSWLYTGNGSTQTITNGIDLAGEGGMVWVKSRSAALNHVVCDTERGVENTLTPNSTAVEFVNDSVETFGSDGFSVGSWSAVNFNGDTYTSWTFRKAPRFFDVVTYTGDGTSNRAIPHNLGTTPGMVVIKRYSFSGGWIVSHRSIGTNDYLRLDNTNAKATSATFFPSAHTDTHFYVGNDGDVNDPPFAGTPYYYVAYLFAHDPLGESGDGSDGLIACGSYTGNGQGYVAGGNTINIGWEPQWVMIFPATVSGYGATIFDEMRGMVEGNVPEDFFLQPSSSAAEASYSAYIAPTSTGFKLETGGGYVNENGQTYVYIAIRRGPMRQPESGTEVFNTSYGTATEPWFDTGFPVDMAIWGSPPSTTSASKNRAMTRFQGGDYLLTHSTEAESVLTSNNSWDYMDGFYQNSGTNTSWLAWMFRRAPGFFDVVAYTGGSSPPNTFKHNLGVAPELMIIKGRNTAYDWFVYSQALGTTPHLRLNKTDAASTGTAYLSAAPDANNFYLNGTALVNNTGDTYIAYLFASLAGISKVGSYTGNGSSQTINCGFTSGARFVMLKRTNNTSDWIVVDTARGIVTGSPDPDLRINTTSAENNVYNIIDPDGSGFIATNDSGLNAVGDTWIFLAIA